MAEIAPSLKRASGVAPSFSVSELFTVVNNWKIQQLSWAPIQSLNVFLWDAKVVVHLDVVCVCLLCVVFVSGVMVFRVFAFALCLRWVCWGLSFLLSACFVFCVCVHFVSIRICSLCLWHFYLQLCLCLLVMKHLVSHCFSHCSTTVFVTSIARFSLR